MVEPEPLDTAGAILFGADQAGLDDVTLLVVNGDVLTDLDLGSLVAFHFGHGGEATIALTPVEDPSAYGVVPIDERGRVLAFIEKPPRGEAPTNLINAGTYVLEPARAAPDRDRAARARSSARSSRRSSGTGRCSPSRPTPTGSTPARRSGTCRRSSTCCAACARSCSCRSASSRCRACTSRRARCSTARPPVTPSSATAPSSPGAGASRTPLSAPPHASRRAPSSRARCSCPVPWCARAPGWRAPSSGPRAVIGDGAGSPSSASSAPTRSSPTAACSAAPGCPV